MAPSSVERERPGTVRLVAGIDGVVVHHCPGAAVEPVRRFFELVEHGGPEGLHRRAATAPGDRELRHRDVGVRLHQLVVLDVEAGAFGGEVADVRQLRAARVDAQPGVRCLCGSTARPGMACCPG